jgi:hypothetical protein
MLRRAFYVCALIAGLTGLVTSSASAVTVDAFANSSSGGIGSTTGVFLTAGQAFTVTVPSDDLWSAAALVKCRWTNRESFCDRL